MANFSTEFCGHCDDAHYHHRGELALCRTVINMIVGLHHGGYARPSEQADIN